MEDPDIILSDPAKLFEALSEEGFAVVASRSPLLVSRTRDCLREAQNFFALPASTKSSCVDVKDRARRGFCPSGSENFASLVGEKAANDVVEKFRVGPPHALQGNCDPLLQPNVWPSAEIWDGAQQFKRRLEEYFFSVDALSVRIMRCIASGLEGAASCCVSRDDFSSSFGLNDEEDGRDFTGRLSSCSIRSSILALNGYKTATTNMARKSDLIAAHTDVGVITILAFDGGDVGRLQMYKKSTQEWVDIQLPSEGDTGGGHSNGSISSNGVAYFVINVGDALSDYTGGVLKSTLHRVRASETALDCCRPRHSLAFFVGLASDARVKLRDGTPVTYQQWRKQKIARSMGMLKASKRRCIVTDAQIECFKKDGVVVIPDMLSKKEVERARRGLHETLASHGVDISHLDETAKNLMPLSSTNGAGGVLDIFYPRWKLNVTLESPKYAQAYAELLAATYGTCQGVWAHPYGDFMASATPLAHVDRIGFRLPEAVIERHAEDSSECIGTARRRKHRLQRSLTPHLDCCPTALHAGGGKKFPRWRPLQCFISLSDSLQRDQGGFECVKGFHGKFEQYYAKPATTENDEVTSTRPPPVCVGDYTAIRPRVDGAILDRFEHMPVPAGAAVFWDQRIPHANARHNYSDQPREVIYGGFLPRVPANEVYAREQARRMRQRLPQPDFWLGEESTGIESRQVEEDGDGGLGRQDFNFAPPLTPFALKLLGKKPTGRLK